MHIYECGKLQQWLEVTNIELKIFDNWGRLIFVTNAANGWWDGQTTRNAPTATGVYVWAAEVRNLLGEQTFVSGTVHLLR